MIKWIGTASSIIGSFLVAVQFLLLGYAFFIVGSVSWLYIGITNRDKPLAVLNATFLCANILGLYYA